MVNSATTHKLSVLHTAHQLYFSTSSHNIQLPSYGTLQKFDSSTVAILFPPTTAVKDSPAEPLESQELEASLQNISPLDSMGDKICSTFTKQYVNRHTDSRVQAHRTDLLSILTSRQIHAALAKMAGWATPKMKGDMAAKAFRVEVGRMARDEGDTRGVQRWLEGILSAMVPAAVENIIEFKRTASLNVAKKEVVLQPTPKRPQVQESITTTPKKLRKETVPSSSGAQAQTNASLPVLAKSSKANMAMFIPSSQTLRIGHRYPAAPTKRMYNFWTDPRNRVFDDIVKKAR